jgi:integrase
MPNLKFTQAAVERLKPPESGRIEAWDSQLPGFGLRIAASGLKTWQACYRVEGKMVREKLGTLAQIPNVAEARDLARQSMTKARTGAHPVEERRRKKDDDRRQAEAEEARKKNTLAALVDRYLAERPVVNQKGKPLAKEYLGESRRTLERDIKETKLGAKPMSEITGEEIRRHVRGIAKRRPSQANHVLAYLSVALNWAVEEGLTKENPAAAVKSPAPKVERERALSDEEIPLFWRACERNDTEDSNDAADHANPPEKKKLGVGWPFGPLARLLLLTAQRRDELAHATWGEFDLDKQTWTIPGARTKNGRPHIVHLSQLAIEILEGLPRVASKQGWVFTTGLGGADTPVSGFGRGRERIAAAIAEISGEAIDPFTLHDLRRSAATGMAALRIAPHVVDKILNHSTGKIAGVAKIYNRYEYAPEREAALEAWGRHVESLIRPTPSNVRRSAASRGTIIEPARLG